MQAFYSVMKRSPFNIQKIKPLTTPPQKPLFFNPKDSFIYLWLPRKEQKFSGILKSNNQMFLVFKELATFNF